MQAPGGAPIDRPLDLKLPVDAASVSAARRAAGAFAHGAGAVRADVELAVSEAVGNSVMHAFPDGVKGSIRVRAALREGDIVVIVEDDGAGMHPRIGGKGLGLGIPLIARLSDDYRIENGSGGGAVVTMRFPTR